MTSTIYYATVKPRYSSIRGPWLQEPFLTSQSAEDALDELCIDFKRRYPEFVNSQLSAFVTTKQWRKSVNEFY